MVAEKKSVPRCMFPIVFAWALTIHKCQGMTLSSAVVSFADCFAGGQGYVARSRVRDLDNLYVTDDNFHNIYPDPDALHSCRCSVLSQHDAVCRIIQYTVAASRCDYTK